MTTSKQQYVEYKADFRKSPYTYWKIMPGESPVRINFDEFNYAQSLDEKYYKRSDYNHVHFKIPISISETSELEKLYEETASLKAKVSQVTSFLKGLVESGDDVTLGNIKNFITANYEYLIKP